VDVSKLFQSVADQVPELAKGIGGIQEPQRAPPGAARSLDIGRVTEQETLH
jgi:hypothetical protein